MTRLGWEQYALGIAEAAAGRSEDPYVKVGAAILRADHTVASCGYNGPPPGIEIDWTDRDARRPLIVHAEANALRYIQPGEGWLLATTVEPCAVCLLTAASYGIRQVVFKDLLPEHYDRIALNQIIRTCDIKMVRYVSG